MSKMANEKRLIDAYQFRGKHEVAEVNGKLCSVILYADIVNAPTVDDVEVKHGRWIFKHDPITDPKGYFIRIVCSECDLHTGQKSNYCPNCGANMKG